MTRRNCAVLGQDLFADQEGHQPRGEFNASAYPAAPGSGPPGETCKTCDNSYMRGGVAGRFWKCALVRETGGGGTDIRVRSPACKHWVAATTTTDGAAPVVQEDIAVPTIKVPGTDDNETRLDLARAYIDMGDPEGCKSLLEQVAREGTETQRELARNILKQLEKSHV